MPGEKGTYPRKGVVRGWKHGSSNKMRGREGGGKEKPGKEGRGTISPTRTANRTKLQESHQELTL